jgi:hypothetical protein
VLSQTAALMVARYLEEIQAASRPVAIDPIVHLPPPPPTPLHLVIEAGGGVDTGQPRAQAVFNLEVAGRKGGWQAGICGAISPNSYVPVDSDPAIGTYRVVPGRVEAEGERRFHLGPGTLRLGLVAGAQMVEVAAKGALLFNPQPSLAASPLVGVRLGYEIDLPWRLAVAIRAEGRWDVQPGDFSVDGFGSLPLPSVDGDLTLAISRVFF